MRSSASFLSRVAFQWILVLCLLMFSAGTRFLRLGGKIVLIFLVCLSLFCRHRSSAGKDSLSSLVMSSSYLPKAYFSYPGRYSDPEKKREVLSVILSLIRGAKFSIKIYAYSLNNPEIISELVESKKRGVKIEIVGDKEQNYDLLQENGFAVNIWKQSGLHHIKVILVDNQSIFTGTGNFSRYGLTNDWNGYIQFEIEEKNRTLVQEFLDQNLKDPILLTNGIYFIASPENGFLSQDLLLEKIESAKVSIDYLIFDHFDSVLTHALKKATSRGVQVTGVYDSPVDDEGEYLVNEFYGLTSGIYRDGNEDIVETEKFPEGGLLHHKSMVIDGKVVLSGSFNYSASARDSNREILFVTEDSYLVSEFQKEFSRVKEKSYQLPKSHLYSFQDHRTVDSTPLEGNTICLPENISYPIIELGTGIWKTYLYYPKVQNASCIPISTFAGISSGISGASKADFFSLDFLWSSWQVYDRNSNLSYSLAKKEESLFPFTKPIEQMNPFYLSFTSTRIYFEMREDLSITDRPIHLWIPGKGIRSAKLERPVPSELGYFANISTLSNERGYAVAFIEALDKTYFFCYKDKTRSESEALNYISKRVFMKQKLETGSESRFQGCIENK